MSICFKRTCVGSNGILECKILSENAHRAIKHFQPSTPGWCAAKQAAFVPKLAVEFQQLMSTPWKKLR